MINYAPIIKNKKAELVALAHASTSVIERLRPLVEIVPDSHPLSVAEALAGAVPANITIRVDCKYLGDHRIRSMREISQYLDDFHIPSLPVVALGDKGAFSTLREIASDGRGVCLRVGSADRDPSISTLEVLLEETLSEIGIDPARVDLLLDYWEVRSDRDMDRIVGGAMDILNWSSMTGWRSVTLAAGAFPDKISHLEKDAVTALPRLDALLWTQAAASLEANRQPDFGDYTIAHPSLPQGERRGPLPNLRYTSQDVWHVYRQANPRGATNYRFHEICAKLVKTEYWPLQGGEFSWGDEELARCARREGGPGGATEWRAWATSHHLAFVTDRLANLGAP